MDDIQRKKEQFVADQMIELMQKLGLSPDEMLKVIRKARSMYNEKKAK